MMVSSKYAQVLRQLALRKKSQSIKIVENCLFICQQFFYTNKKVINTKDATKKRHKFFKWTHKNGHNEFKIPTKNTVDFTLKMC